MKSYLIILAFTCLAAPLFAQFSLGLTAGTNMSYWKWHNQDPAYEINFEPALGWRAAVLGEWQISPLLGLRTEIGAQVKSNKGGIEYSDDQGGVIPGATAHQHFQYWEGSLLLQLSPVKKIKQVYLLAGCSAGRLVKGWRNVSGSAVPDAYTRNQSIALDENKIDRNALMADVGLGGNIPLGAHNSLKIEGRYQHGLTNFSTISNVDRRVSALILSVGYLHRL